MHPRGLAASISVLALASVLGGSGLQAQAASTPKVKVLCAPAPLTERPGIQADFAQPHVAPLESAFADAARVKRLVGLRRMKDPR